MQTTNENINWEETKRYLPGGGRTGWTIHSAPEMPSTQIPAKESARRGGAHGQVFVTDFQNAGRGRRDRGWVTRPRTDLTFSAILRPGIRASDAPLINLTASLAVASALKKIFGPGPGGPVSIKWPNDVLAGDKKICGMICECSAAGGALDYAVLGVGVNANRAAGDMPGATSILAETGRGIDLPRLLAAVLTELDEFVPKLETGDGLNGMLEMYRGWCSTIGRDVLVTSDDGEFSGRAVGITDRGAVAVEGADGERRVFDAADVIHARALPCTSPR
jgi:BirA family biotin operon repressor/biotin-[acetyl-CoA-carboxylase] ligase